ncbi:MAG: M14 family metallopeptidase [Bacteroidales bacterium]|nr:M14 family metallopeptidase [Bacteroidales bacterium]
MKKFIQYIWLLLISMSATALLQGQTYTSQFFKAAGSPANPKVKVSWNHYHTIAGIESLCKEMVKAYPDLVKLQSIGKSVGNRDIWVLTVSDFSKGNPDRKPAMWVDANLHGNEIQGTEMALYLAWYLIESFNDNAFIRELLEQKTFYISPTINPDGRAVFTQEAGALRSGILPLDNDRDGIADEDGPQDLNGDGFITQMRRKNPNGTHTADPNYPNRLILAPVGVQGQYDLLGIEALDMDGDGRAGEDGPGGYDPNRDFGFNWQPNFLQGGALKYPFSLPESQALSKFFLSHPNIAGVQTFHNNGGMILSPPGSELDADRVSRSDRAVYDAIGKKGEEMIPSYRYMVVYKDLYTIYGGSLDWFAFCRGIFSFCNELWHPDWMYHGRYQGDRATTMEEFNKTMLLGDAYVPWTEFDHPVYGKIEIGGLKKNSTQRLHPGFLLEADAHRNAMFVLHHAYCTPQLSIGNVTDVAIEGGYRQITAEVYNSRLIPTHSTFDMQNRIERPDWVSISGPQVIVGMVMSDPFYSQGVEQKVNPQKLAVANIPGNGKVVVRWIVKGNQKYTITVDSAKGGVVVK